MESTEYNNEENEEDITTEVISETDVDNTTGTTTEEVAISTEQNIPVISDENPTYYEIQYGDTLSSIAFEQYGSSEYARDIAEANNMDVDDKIYEGEELILPVISTE